MKKYKFHFKAYLFFFNKKKDRIVNHQRKKIKANKISKYSTIFAWNLFVEINRSSISWWNVYSLSANVPEESKIMYRFKSEDSWGSCLWKKSLMENIYATTNWLRQSNWLHLSPVFCRWILFTQQAISMVFHRPWTYRHQRHRFTTPSVQPGAAKKESLL